MPAQVSVGAFVPSNNPAVMPEIAYCTNVHAGADLRQTRANLLRYACEVKRQFSPNRPMVIGLWLSARAAAELADPRELDAFRSWLSGQGLVPLTLNGFPYGDFHQERVKHDVYHPTWFEDSRRTYTRNLIHLVNALAPPGVEVTISTLPIAWGNPKPSFRQQEHAAKLLSELADELAALQRDAGRAISLCIEPEPGCMIETGQGLIDFFEQFLLPAGNEAHIRQHIRVCHDVCHAVVMRESQRDVLSAYQAAGIAVGKIQISSAIVVDFDNIEAADRNSAWKQLASFAEDRYLHQTTVTTAEAASESDSGFTFFEDLPQAMESVGSADRATGNWRIHFHIPVYLQKFGWLHGSQEEISDCVRCCREFSNVQHFEVETYAWNVLPSELQQPELASGISDELAWFEKLAKKYL